MLRKETRPWWAGHRWLTRPLLWLIMVNGLVVLTLFALPLAVDMDPNQDVNDVNFVALGLQALFQLGTIGMALGAIILSQDLVIGERQSGVTEWILAKPISRPAYLLSKLTANAVGILAVVVWLQSAFAYGLLSLANSGPIPLQPFVAGVAGQALHTMFYVALTLMMGVFTDSRGTLLGVAMGTLFGGLMLLNILGKLALLTPWVLPMLLPSVAMGEPLPLPVSLPIIATVAWFAVFIVAALWKVRRLEF
jgi:ABC-type transport system involved in multi-copper enzyme maturation permease subunit